MLPRVFRITLLVILMGTGHSMTGHPDLETNCRRSQ